VSLPALSTSTRRNLIGLWVVGLAFVSVVFGGASRDHALRLALVELAALPLLLLAGLELLRGDWRRWTHPLLLLAAVAALPLLQLTPLPFDLWRSLPGREPIAQALDLAGVSPGWVSVSVAPEGTWSAILALVPPAAMFCAVLVAPPESLRTAVAVYLVAAVASLFLGVAQILGGPDSALYGYDFVSYHSPVGFFANSNHLASFLVATLPLGAVVAARALRRRHRSWRVVLAGVAVVCALALVGVLLTTSRAGLMLAGPALMASLAMVWIGSGRARPRPAVVVGALGLALALTAAAAVLLFHWVQSNAGEYRFGAWPVVAEAADAYQPLGAGIGSFDPVYRSVEPVAAIGPAYLNHAHNEYLELWLEAGWPAAILLALFLVWWLRRSFEGWRRPPGSETDLARAGAVVVLLLLLHSATDYPLRTETMAVMFAFAAAAVARVTRSPRRTAGEPRRAPSA